MVVCSSLLDESAKREYVEDIEEEYEEVTFYLICINKTLKSMRRWVFIFVRLICSDFHDLCNWLGEGRPLRQPAGEKVLQS